MRMTLTGKRYIAVVPCRLLPGLKSALLLAQQIGVDAQFTRDLSGTQVAPLRQTRRFTFELRRIPLAFYCHTFATVP